MSQDEPAARIVACPQCGTAVEWSERSPCRPFCSERCKLIDLGRWLGGKYQIPVVEKDESDKHPGADYTDDYDH